MAPSRWIRAAVLAASSAVLTSFPALAESPRQTPSPTAARPRSQSDNAPVDPGTLVDQDLADLYTRLVRAAPAPGAPDEAAVQQAREDAARRLVSRQSARVNKYLLDTLTAPTTSISREIKVAIVRAIAEADDPDPVFIGGLVPLLESERNVAPALARLGNYPTARGPLMALAQNPAQPVPVRTAIIRALAQVVSRDVANELVALASDPAQPQAVQDAAADALSELTRLPGGDPREPGRWKQWQAANAAKPDVNWLAEVLGNRQPRMEHEDHAQNATIDELKRILGEQYQQAERDQKFAMVMRWLNSPEPQTRLMGIQMVESAHDTGSVFPPQAPRRIQELIGDSDPSVRLAAAVDVQSRNDIDALNALLTQLAQETNTKIKLAQIGAIEPMKRVRALPTLRALLHDPSLAVASAAVRALQTYLLSAEYPTLSREIADELLKVGVEREHEPGGVNFRALTIRAAGAIYGNPPVRNAAPSATKGVARQMLDLLKVEVDPRLRAAALHGLGDIADPATSFPIAEWLASEPSAAVRLEAIRALGSASSFEDAAETLNNFMSPNTEPDKSVRDEAWAQFKALLPKANKLEVLKRWESEFQNDPTRQLQVQLVLNDKLQQAGNGEELAYARQNTGQTYLKLGDPAAAAVEFAAALDYWQKHNAANQVTESLIKQNLESELAARHYSRAVEFAAKQLADPRLQTMIGPALRDAAEKLKTDGLRDNDAQKLKDATALIDAALKMQPSLAEQYQTDLRDSQQEIAMRLKGMRKP